MQLYTSASIGIAIKHILIVAVINFSGMSSWVRPIEIFNFLQEFLCVYNADLEIVPFSAPTAGLVKQNCLWAWL